ncbi:MAG: CHAT domain-containing protein [Saprospiraceae bacterium]|nr:CHAT domain-containing protein [Saprospiraceae bacterium]
MGAPKFFVRVLVWHYLMTMCFSIIVTHTLAQDNLSVFDSLESEWQKIPDDDTTGKAEVLIEAMHRENQNSMNHYDSTLARIILADYLRDYNELTPAEALPRLRKIEHTFLSLHNIDPLVQAKFHNQLVIEFRSISQNDSLERHLDLMAQYLAQVKKPSTLKITLEYERARHAYLQNDFQGSLTYLQYALQYLDKYFPNEVLQRLSLLNGIGIGYRRTNQSDKAIEHHHKTLVYLESHPEHADYEGNILNNLGLCHADLSQNSEAIYFMQKAIAAYKNLGSRYIDQIATGYVNIASVYSGLGQVDSAVGYIDRSLKLMQETYGSSYPDQLFPLASVTNFYYAAEQFDLADSAYSYAVSFLKSLGWSATDPDGDYYIFDAFDLLTYGIKIKTALYERNQDIRYLQEAIHTADAFMATVDYAIDGLKNAVSKEVFQGSRGPTFSVAIDNLYTLFKLTNADSLVDKAYAYSEKLKSLELLYASIKDRIDENEIYRQLNQEYQVLMDSILPLEKSLVLAQDSNQLHRETFKNRLVQAQHNLSNWRTTVEKEFPQYQQLIFHPEQIKIDQLQQHHLEPDQSILSFHITDSTIYGICINQQATSFHKIAVEFNLSRKIAELRNNVYAYFVTGDNSEEQFLKMCSDYIDAARELYNALIQPFEEHLERRVIIIPDKALAYLPFDLLLSSEPKEKHTFKNHPYLMRKYAISYCYSVALWLEIMRKERSDNRELLAFAPAFKELELPKESLYAVRTGLAPLDYNTNEVNGIHQHFKGTIISGGAATKEKFLQHVQDFGLIHLATHSKANDAAGDFSYLAFSNLEGGENKLYANEIYSLNLHADLVTLSACESGIGELRYGEGIISLARAFVFAGAKSILSTLWAVNDKSTGTLMTGFYKNLAADMPKDIALQKAKLDYLNDHDHSAAHPFYWSGFISIGDQSPVSESSSIYSWVVLLLLGIIAVIWIMQRRI